MFKKNVIRQLAEILYVRFWLTVWARWCTGTATITFTPYPMPSVDDIGYGGLADAKLFGDVFEPFSFRPHGDDGGSFFWAKVAFLHKKLVFFKVQKVSNSEQRFGQFP